MQTQQRLYGPYGITPLFPGAAQRGLRFAKGINPVTITASVIADSENTHGDRLTTMQLRYPRFIHAEFMTHRVFSRNASSSRAVPVERLITDILRDPAMPIHWGKNQPGMSAREELLPLDKALAKVEWLAAMNQAIKYANKLILLGAHKQIVNRILEPFSHINVLVTATEYANFFTLRRHADAQPEIKALADAMWTAMQGSVPNLLTEGEWHLPYIEQTDRKPLPGDDLRKVSTARCARLSYLTFEGKRSTVVDDVLLFDKLMASEPVHASPAEHQACADPNYYFSQDHGNFAGFRQYRKTLGF